MTDESAQLGPSYDGTVMLDIGGDIGALILVTSSEWLLAEIEISPLGDDPGTHGHSHDDHTHEHDGHAHTHGKRQHVAVRERRGPDGVRYAAIYPELREGTYQIWDLDGQPAGTADVTGGKVTELTWP